MRCMNRGRKGRSRISACVGICEEAAMRMASELLRISARRPQQGGQMSQICEEPAVRRATGADLLGGGNENGCLRFRSVRWRH